MTNTTDSTGTPDRDTLQAEHDALIKRMATSGYTIEDIRTSERQIARLGAMTD